MTNPSETPDTQDGQSLNPVHDDNVSRDEQATDPGKWDARNPSTEQCGTQNAFFQKHPRLARQFAYYLDKEKINDQTITGASIQDYIDANHPEPFAEFCSRTPETLLAAASDVGCSAMNAQRRHAERRQSRKSRKSRKISEVGDKIVDGQTVDPPSTAASQGN